MGSLRVLALLACLSVLPSANTAELSGTWKGSFNFQGTDVLVTFHLMEVNGSVTGTVEGLSTTPAEIHDGKTDGDSVGFWLSTDYEGTTYKLIYSGKISPDGIRVSFGTEDAGWSTEMTAVKAPQPTSETSTKIVSRGMRAHVHCGHSSHRCSPAGGIVRV